MDSYPLLAVEAALGQIHRRYGRFMRLATGRKLVSPLLDDEIIVTRSLLS